MFRKLSLIVLLLLSAAAVKAQYEGAPTVDVSSGSTVYQTIGNAVNGWATTFHPTSSSALTNRSSIIDQVEATATAAAKDEISDTEYDALAVVIYWWLQKVTEEGVATGDGNNIKSGGWRMGFLVDPSFGSGDNSVWELSGEEVLFHDGYVALDGIKIPSGCRLVIFASTVSKSTIKKKYDGGAYTAPNVMFQSTGGKLIFFANSDHQLALDGGKNRTDAASYSDVLNRNDETSSQGQLCHIHGGGALLSTYTSFQNNATGSAAVQISSNEKYNGGAIAFSGNVSLASFYKATVKNNSTQNHFGGIEWSCFGGGIGIQDVETTGGFYFNRCEITGNYTEGHGGGFAAYFDGSTTAEIVFKNTTFKYNCQAEQREHHGGGLWYHDSGSSRSCQVTGCSFVNNYSAGLTAGGGGISNEGHITITGCTFDSNVAQNSFGGAICARPALDLTTLKKIEMEIGGCTFTNNQAKWTGDIASGDGTESNYERGSGGAIFIELRRDSHDANNCQYISSLKVKDDCVFNGNHADRNGGGIAIVMPDDMKNYMQANPTLVSSNLTVSDATIENNNVGQTAIPWTGTYNHDNGGAIYLLSTDLTINPNAANGDAVLVKDNNAPLNGGAVAIFGASLTMTGGQFGESGHPNTAKDGAAVYVSDGNVTVSNATFAYNEASGNGGGFYVSGGSVNLTNATVDHNKSMTVSGYGGYGGGFYVVEGSAGTIGNTTITGGNVSNNEADVVGGGFFVNGGVTTIKEGACIEGNEATNGGGAYVNSGTLNVQDATTIAKSNIAEENGGGFYVNGGVFNMTGGAIGANNYPNHATNGGGVYANGGEVNISNGYIQYNTATTGGGFYMQGGTATIEGGTVQNNTATNGGGLYMEGTSESSPATAEFENGVFQNNVASANGGGIYLANYSELYMSGSSAITGNSAGVKGGGVFKTAGNGHSKLQVSGTSLQVVNNTVGSQRNNVYLDSYSDYITVDPDDGISDQVKVGISVNVNSTADLPTPVIHCDDVSKLNAIFNMLKTPDGTNGVFDDASKYLAIYQSHPLPFNDKEIFFIATWIAEVTEPEHFDATMISTPEELAWFMVLVNGLNGQTPQPGLSGTVINDIDMSAYYWTPIGEWNHSDPEAPQSVYNGTFDGQGHTISGVSTCGVINYYNYGLFGHTSNANISNVVLADCDFTSGEAKRMGNLIAEMDGGTVSNCIVSGKLNPSGSETQGSEEHYCVVGGLIGETKNNAIIRNCIATEQIQAEPIVDEFYPGMQAFTVGGLVGMASASTVIENCFANTEIYHGGNQGNETTLMDPNRYVGGLIGENYGTVRNCYVRLERNNELTTTVSKFGMFAGRNSGTIDYCYYPVESLRNIKVGGVSAPNQIVVNDGTAPTNHGQYSAVTRPYTYTSYLVDNQVDGGTTEATTLLSKLNDWVGNQTNYSNYSRWMRTEGSDVNDDYPVLSYDNLISTLDYTTVGSKDGIQLEYDNRFNDMYGRFKKVGEGCLFIYRTPWTGTIASPADEVIGHDPDDEDFTVDNSENDIKVFVKDGVALLQDASSKLENTYTCHKFNDASRTWHHISSSLNSDSPIGFSYAQTGEIAYDEDAQNPCGASVMSEANASFLPAGIPMADLDLYCFYETEYHWINFKRNSSSHWHMNDQHQNITYNNEDNLLAGKGYLASFANRTFVQAGGELANGDVNVGVTAKAGSLNGSATPAIPAEEGTELKGYNLLGNPYQSYLDIAAFMTKNSSLLVNTGKSGIDVPSYAIYDSEANAYVQGMASKPSLGSRAASDQIRMHEGFFIYTSADGNATFTNEMRRTPYTSTGTKSTEQPAYPLVNLMVTDANGESDIAVAEFGRTQTEGAAKMKHIGADGKIYFHYANDDYALLYLNEDIDQLPVRFDAIEDGNYTMTWSTANATFSYLHLVDNMTGIDVDMLSSDGYTFTAGTSDYKSRFKLMFAYTGVEENGAAEMETFAFMHNGALTVNGEGWLEVIDMNGRTIVSSRLTDAQNTVSLPQTAQGVYVLRLTSDNQSKVQKIVVR